MSADRQIEHVTCLGCGCGCDDLTVRVSDNRIVETDPYCPLGRAWFGDGQVPSEIVSQGQPATLEQTLATVATTLAGARGHCLVYLSTDLSSQAQRAALALADLLNATVDCATSDSAAQGLLTVQRRGKAGATLGEIRNRGDVVLFWGVDPRDRYPRFLARYGLDPAGTHVPQGRSGRYVISVSVGADRSLPEGDLNLAVSPEMEIAALTLMRASVLGRQLPASSSVAESVAEMAGRLARAGYAVLVHDAEPTAEPRNPLRAEALVALTQALNGPTRAALCSLRAGGNRVGAEAVMTWQTGYPFAVDYAPGFPRYQPGRRGIDGAAGGGYRAALVVGSPPPDAAARMAFSAVPPAVIGPRASQAPFPTTAAIDTGVAGIHEEGMAYRMDEVPLTLRPSVDGPRRTAEVLQALGQAIRAELRRRAG